MSADRFAKRRQQLRQIMSRQQLDALLVSGERNVTWLTGFTGDSSWLLLTSDRDVLISDFRFITQIDEECPGLEKLIRSSAMSLSSVAVSPELVHRNCRRMGVEGHLMSASALENLKKARNETDFVLLSGPVEALRAVKDAAEIADIRQAVRFAEKGFEFLKAVITPEATERQLSAEMEHAVRRMGADGYAFPAIIAVGDRAALPHYRPGERKISESPILLVDWGVRTHRGYRSDLTRTVLTGKPDRKFEKVYRTVLEAQLLAIGKIAPGVACKEVDALARDHIRKKGFEKYFDHGLGHGIGLDVHEQPRFSRSSEDVLQPGMVVTVEPGIYLPGWGGVRIEDDVLVTRTGHEVLSSVPKDWESIRWN